MVSKRFGNGTRCRYWPTVSVPPAAISTSVWWPVTTDPLIQAGNLREAQALESHKAHGFDGLCSDLFKGEGMELITELQVLYSEV